MLADWVRGRALSSGFRYHAGRDLHERSIEDFQVSAPAWSTSTCSAPGSWPAGSRSSTSSGGLEHDVSIHHEIADPGEQLAWRARALA